MITSRKIFPLTMQSSVRQFIRFGTVGASSAAVNFFCFNLFNHEIGMLLLPSLTLAFLMAGVNGFYWNLVWTFQRVKAKPLHAQLFQFLLVSAVGWLVNTCIVVVVLAYVRYKTTGVIGSETQCRHIIMAVIKGTGRDQYSFWQLNGALAIATMVLMFWNFFINRLWTFRDI